MLYISGSEPYTTTRATIVSFELMKKMKELKKPEDAILVQGIGGVGC